MHCTSCSCIWALVRYHICTCNLYATTGYTWHSLKRGGIMITFSPSACLSCCPSHADIKPTRPAIARYDGCSPELCPCGQSIYLPAWTRLQVGESITMQKWNSPQGGQVHCTRRCCGGIKWPRAVFNSLVYFTLHVWNCNSRKTYFRLINFKSITVKHCSRFIYSMID